MMKRVLIKDIIHTLNMENFYKNLFNKKVLRHKMRGIKSKNHNLITYESNLIYILF